MITSIFRKSKPINYIIITVFVVLIFVITNYNLVFESFSSARQGFTKLLVALITVFLLDFIVTKNDLTLKNNYAIMSFTFFLVLFPQALINYNMLFSNVFVVLALRRLISLHSKTNINKKLFDVGFWIAFATLFYFWAILFFALLIVMLIYYMYNDIKNAIIPFIGVITVIIILIAYNCIVHNTYIASTNFNIQTSFDYTNYNSLKSIIRLTTLITLFIWVLLYFFKILKRKNKNLTRSYLLILLASVIAITIAMLAPMKNGNEFLFLFVPFSILIANYIEIIKEHWFKEVFVTLLLAIPILCLLL